MYSFYEFYEILRIFSTIFDPRIESRLKIQKLAVIKCKILLTFMLSESESVKFLLMKSEICLFTDTAGKKYYSLLNQLIFIDSLV